jgi:hypothetical protein
LYRCISASAVCANGDIVASALPSVGVDVKANLAPALGDVDLGTDFGLQFAASAVGDFLDVPVRVNAASGKLYSYQIDVVWDSAHFKATACTVGGGWAADWACTLNDPPNKALIAASSLSSTAKGGAVQVQSS